MFLFFSKLLPLLVYPLGLSCLLTILGLVLLWRSPRAAAVAMVLSLLVLVGGSNSLTASALVQSLEARAIALETAATGNPPGDLPAAEAIVVLGGGTRPADPPRPWVDLMEEGDRVLYGAKLFLEGKAPYLILSGGRISWNGEPGRSESEDMAAVARAMGVPGAAILQDPTSLNTRQNAVNVGAILERENLGRILLVTSALHMPRSTAIFRKLGIDTVPAPTDFLFAYGDARPDSWEAIAIALLPDADSLRQTTRALKEYLGIVVYWLRGWV